LSNPIDQQLVGIVEKASSLFERLGPDFVLSSEVDAAKADRLLEEWCRVAVGGDQKLFERRLSWDQVDTDRLRRAITGAQLRDGVALPSWAEFLRAVLAAAPSCAEGPHHPLFDPEDPVAFEELLLPFILVARNTLKERSGDLVNHFAPETYRKLERSLLKRLSTFAAQALYLEFHVFRSVDQLQGASWLAHALPIGSRRLYDQFVAQMLEGGLRSFCARYAVLARLLAIATRYWVEGVAEMLGRLAADSRRLRDYFQMEGDLGPIINMETYLSDPHYSGRTSMALRFQSGLRLIYKPKSMAAEQNFSNLVTWLNERGLDPALKPLRVLDSGTHGWVEVVDQLPCQDEAEARRFYKRAGMLLCLLYALEGSDCHSENVIAHGEYPMVIDLETLLHHRSYTEAFKQPRSMQILAWEDIYHSVLGPGLLPRWEVGPSGETYDTSGLGGSDGRETPFTRRQLRHPNTDAMALVTEQLKVGVGKNRPVLNGQLLSAVDFVNELIEGFRYLYGVLLAHRTTLLEAPDSPLRPLAVQPVRIVHRNTRVYAVLLKEAMNPKFLEDGADRTVQLDVIGRGFLLGGDSNPLWPMARAEFRSLYQLDVPFFCTHADRTSLQLETGGELQDVYTEPSYQVVLRQLKGFGPADQEKQVGYIRGTLYSHIARDIDSGKIASPPSAGLSADGLPALTPEQAVAEAVRLAEEIRSYAIREKGKGATWIGLAYIPDTQEYHLRPMGFPHYEGLTGVALFLAVLERVTGGAGFRDLALEALEELHEEIRRPELKNGLYKYTGIGGALGLGSLIHSLTHLSDLLGKAELLEEALYLSALLTREHLHNDPNFDVMFGSAGAILSLLTLYRRTGEPQVLEKVCASCDHLLAKRVAAPSGHRAWVTLNKQLLTGFSHGAAGITYALLCAFRLTGREAYREAAREAYAYESSMFSPQVQNWPDLRFPPIKDRYVYQNTWCNGPLGIGLGRLAAQDCLDSEDVRRDIEVAVTHATQQPMFGGDILCCGLLGRTELLLVAARKLARPELHDLALRTATAIVGRARERGKYGISWEQGPYHPGLFQGTAGVGYQLLRLAYPQQVPSLLLWE
jgi:type 2 lantibiotic biosynthesis protein LanM